MNLEMNMKLRTLLVVKTISKVLFIYLKEDQNMNNTALRAKKQTISFISLKFIILRLLMELLFYTQKEVFNLASDLLWN